MLSRTKQVWHAWVYPHGTRLCKHLQHIFLNLSNLTERLSDGFNIFSVLIAKRIRFVAGFNIRIATVQLKANTALEIKVLLSNSANISPSFFKPDRFHQRLYCGWMNPLGSQIWFLFDHLLVSLLLSDSGSREAQETRPKLLHQDQRGHDLIITDIHRTIAVIKSI